MPAKKQAKQTQPKGAWKATTALAKNAPPKAKPKALDFTKPVRTKRGEPVRVLTTDAKCRFPIVGLVMRADGEEEMESWTAGGQHVLGRPSAGDLETVPQLVKYKAVAIHVPQGLLPPDGKESWVLLVDVTVDHTSDRITHVELSK